MPFQWHSPGCEAASMFDTDLCCNCRECAFNCRPLSRSPTCCASAGCVNTVGTNSCDWDWGSKAVSYLQPLVANDGNESFDGMTDIGLQLRLQAPRHINADGRQQRSAP